MEKEIRPLILHTAPLWVVRLLWMSLPALARPNLFGVD